jgi:hypothetical protein
MIKKVRIEQGRITQVLIDGIGWFKYEGQPFDGEFETSDALVLDNLMTSSHYQDTETPGI